MDKCDTFTGHPLSYQAIASDALVSIGTPVFAWESVEPSCGTDMCINPEHLVARRPLRLNYPEGVCVYCGQRADTKDHLLPRNASGDAWRQMVLTVPACRECNSILGESPLESITSRRVYIQERLKMRNRKLLSTIELGDYDLAELGPGLSAFVSRAIQDKLRLLERLSWPVQGGYDLEALQGSGIEDPFATGLLEAVDQALWSRLRPLLGSKQR